MARTTTTSFAQDEVAAQGVVLLLQVPRTNEKKELAAEQMFASLHGLLTLPSQSKWRNQPERERISFEIAVREKRIGFYVWVPKYLESFVEEQIYAQYPTVQISVVEDYALNHTPTQSVLTTDLHLSAPDALPIKTFQSFEVDPLAAITATLAKFEADEEAWIQLVLRPADQHWHKKSEAYIAKLKAGGGSGGIKWSGLAEALWTPPTEEKGQAAKPADYDQTRTGAAQDKSQKLAFDMAVRIVYRGNVPESHARLRMQSIVASYKQFNTTYLNSFAARRLSSNPTDALAYTERQISGKKTSTFIGNIEEAATLYHLPHTNVETPFILWANAQTAEPPANLPLVTQETVGQVSPVATTNFRGHNTAFGLPRSDRGRHMYIIGQTGVGKSGLLELLTISDIYSPYGFAVIDPHGDYAQNILRRLPPERVKDVVYFNPADVDFPIAFNPLEVVDTKLRTHTCSELIGVLKRMFESWGPRLEYILRYSILALLDYPQATMLDITRILTDKKFRNEVLKHVSDPVVQNFWYVEFASWNDKFAAEAVAPVLNKVGAFTANPLVRNIIGQPKSGFNIRQIMDENKILIINLSRGLVGEDNAALLGALLVTKIQMAAMSRADVRAEDRSPFYLYVDEFQNFATDSFATILSEARKYGLCLTVANQYTSQMLPQVKDAVFGNVGTIVAFRMSADDATSMQKYYEPKFVAHDLVHMHNRTFVLSMTIEGEKVQAFSAASLTLPPYGVDYTDIVIENSRRAYASSLDYVERYVSERYLKEQKPAAPQQPKPKPPVAAVTPPPAADSPEPAAAPISPEQPERPKPKPKSPAEAVLRHVIEVTLPAKKRRRRRKKKTTPSAEND